MICQGLLFQKKALENSKNYYNSVSEDIFKKP